MKDLSRVITSEGVGVCNSTAGYLEGSSLLRKLIEERDRPRVPGSSPAPAPPGEADGIPAAGEAGRIRCVDSGAGGWSWITWGVPPGTLRSDRPSKTADSQGGGTRSLYFGSDHGQSGNYSIRQAPGQSAFTKLTVARIQVFGGLIMHRQFNGLHQHHPASPEPHCAPSQLESPSKKS